MKEAIAAVALAATAALYADYTPEKWNLEARDKFADQRFGIFIHWGLYAYYAQGEWYQQNAGLDTETYGRIIDGFYPSKFDAKEWVRENGDAIYGTRGVGLVKNPDGSETGKTKKGDVVYEITIPKGAKGFPVVKTSSGQD